MSDAPTTPEAGTPAPTEPITPPVAPIATDPVEGSAVEPVNSKVSDGPETEKTFTQAQVNALLAKQKRSIKSGEEPSPLEDEVKSLRAAIDAKETAAMGRLVAQYTAQFHSPDHVKALVSLEGLSSDDPEAVRKAFDDFAAANAYTVKAVTTTAPGGAPAPVAGADLTPAPGATQGQDSKLLSEAQLNAMTTEELASDPEKRALYMKSRKALRGEF